jgi:cytochrome c556
VRHPHAVAVAVVTIFATCLALRAQGPPAGGGGAKPLVPMTASSLMRDPQSHIGENVSLMATVDAILSKTAFTLDQDASKHTGQEVLVLAPTLTAAPDLNGYVTVQGEVMRFDPAEIAKRNKSYTIDLPQDAVAKYQGKPVILATAVVNPKLVDLAKRVLPPMTPAEVEFRKAMLAINPTFTALRGGLDAPNAATVKEQVTILKTSFTAVEAYFKSKGTTEAAGYAGEAIKAVTTMEQGAATAKWEDVKAAAGTLQGMCATCHGAFRERQDDGSFRIKG